MIRLLALGLVCGLAGCGVSDNLGAAIGVGVTAGTVAAIGRSPG